MVETTRSKYKIMKDKELKNILKSELGSSDPFRNAIAMNRRGISQAYLFATKIIGYHSNVPWATAKRTSD